MFSFGWAKSTIWAMVLSVFIVSNISIVKADDDDEKHEESEKSLRIGALGKLKPVGGMIEIVGLAGTNIEEILVSYGSTVEKGQILARFSNHKKLNDALDQIKLEKQELVANYKQDRHVQLLRIASAKSDKSRADTSLANYEALVKSAQAATVLEARKGEATSAKHALNISQAEVNRIDTRFKMANEKVASRIRMAEQDLELSALYSPINGTVIETLKSVGQTAGGPIFLVSNLSQMWVECEVFEGDMKSVSLEMEAEVTSKAFAETLKGTVSQIGRRVDAVRKVAKIWVTLSDSALASKYIGMEVNVSIKPKAK